MPYPCEYDRCHICGKLEATHHGDECRECKRFTCPGCMARMEGINTPTLCQPCAAKRREAGFRKGVYK